MKRLGLTGVVALVLLGAAPAATNARPFGPDEELAYQIAASFWGAEPNCTTVVKSVEPLPENVLGQVTMPTDGPIPCVLKVASASTAWFGSLCLVVTHEYGHLLGRGHALDPADIMHPSGAKIDLSVVPGCAAEFARRQAAIRRWRSHRRFCRSLQARLRRSEQSRHRWRLRLRTKRCWRNVRTARSLSFSTM